MTPSPVNCIIIHGCPNSAEKDRPVKERYYHHWIPWVRQKLIKKGIKTDTPLMPSPWRPEYKKFKKEFEKYTVTKNTILIGHSCGGAFLVRWLGETKSEVGKLVIVAPWTVDDTHDEYRKSFYGFTIDKTIKERVNKIILFTSDNEAKNGKEALRVYKRNLGGKIIELKGMGHYCVEEMGREEFQELVNNI